jgi:undecaprenyl diphosphate synthase
MIVPRHVAIIMDGNGRWAKKRALPRIAGHKKGAETLRRVLGACRELGIRHLTVYAFSAENWQRPQEEVSGLMGLLAHHLSAELEMLKEHGIRLRVIGEVEQLSAELRGLIARAEEETRGFDRFHLSICLSYGARQEITRAARLLAEEAARGTLPAQDITEAELAARLFTRDLPDPDLLIRTGGEQRLSNFLLWQSAYTELYFSDVAWPDFTPEHLRAACAEYASRERRYGKT